MTAARRGYVDLIVDPADTRKYLVDAFEMLGAVPSGKSVRLRSMEQYREVKQSEE